MTDKTLEQWQEMHSEMLATAHDLSLELPEELKADFTDAGAGKSICDAVDALIRAHREGRDTGLASDDGGAHSDASPAPKKTAKKSSPAKAKKAVKKTEANLSTDEKSEDTTKEKQQVAKSPAKKAKAKTAKKKAASANARKAAGGGKQVSFPEDAKINWLGKDNPSSLETGKGQRIDNVRKHNGKTVKTYLTTGKGKRGTLGWCVKGGLVKVA